MYDSNFNRTVSRIHLSSSFENSNSLRKMSFPLHMWKQCRRNVVSENSFSPVFKETNKSADEFMEAVLIQVI